MTSAQDRNPIRFAGSSGLSSGARRLKDQLERARKLRPVEPPRQEEHAGDRHD